MDRDRANTDPPEEQLPRPARAEALEPKPLQPSRVNRRVLALVGILAILILWSGVWVFSRTAQRPKVIEVEAPTPVRLDGSQIARLERRARPTPDKPPSRFPSANRRPAPPRPAPTSPGPAPSRSRSRRQRLVEASYDADRVLPVFANRTPYSGYFRGTIPDEPDAVSLLGRHAASAGRTESARPAVLRAENGSSLLDRKETFLRRVATEARDPDVPLAVRSHTSPYVVQEGWLIPAVLVTGIHSDLPGTILALVRAPVYDSATGRFELLPTGTRLIGTYDSRVAFGQRRILAAWTRLIFPDGRWIDLGAMPGVDLTGMAGLEDRVNNHFIRTFGSALLISAFTAGAQLSQPQESQSFGEAASTRQILAAALGQEINRTADQLLRENLSVEPTLEIRPGYQFYVQLNQDLHLPSPYRAEGRR